MHKIAVTSCSRDGDAAVANDFVAMCPCDAVLTSKP